MENEIAKAVQSEVPLVRDPWGALAESLNVSREAILEQLRAWDRDGKLREISAVLEGDALGYESALCTGRVADVERAAEILNAHPTITHNYVREHDFNLWFTIAMPRDIGIDVELSRLSAATGSSFFALRRTHTFKIGVRFDLETMENTTAPGRHREVADLPIGDREKRLFRALQQPLPYTDRPFAALGDEDELLAFANEHLGASIRRYVATFRHRKLGVGGNGMIVWNTPHVVDVGTMLAAAPEVSHCYARNAIEGFPYTLYSMVHGRDRDAVLATARALSERVRVDDYRVLFSTRELKKTRLRYFQEAA